MLTHKQLEIGGCKLSPVDTDGLVLKHQAISIHSADKIDIHCFEQISENFIQK